MAPIKPEIIRMSYEINKAYINMNIDCRTRDLVLFCDTFEFEAAICRLSKKFLTYSGNFENSLLRG